MAMDKVDGRDGAMSAAVVSEADAACAAACLFNGLSDPSRVAILRVLLSGERNVAQLRESVGLAQSTVSKHLACLRECGLVDMRPVGRQSLYSVAHPDLVMAVFVAAEGLLAATGDAVTICPQTMSATQHCSPKGAE